MTDTPLLLGMGSLAAEPGGLNRYVHDLGRALGIEPVVADPRLPLALRLLRVRAATHARHGRLVDAHFALYAFAALAGRRTRFVVHFHGPWADESAATGETGWSVFLKRAVERSVYRRARCAVVMSRAFAAVLSERYGIPADRIVVIPPGVDLERFSPGDRSEARARLGIDPDSHVAVTVRRLVPRMGVDVLLEAIPAETILLVAGDGPERSRLEALAGPNVRFLGRVDDETLVDLYRAADVSVVPSRALEGFGLVVLESLACGTPAIVTDAGGLPEAVEGLEPTLVVPAGDAAALRQRLMQPLPSPEACRAHAERFSWSAAAARHRELYAEASRTKVVFLDHTATLSGGELALARLLSALDVNAHVILGEDGPLAVRLRELGATVEVLPFAARELPRERVGAPLATLTSIVYSVRLARRLRALRPDVVHANSLKSGLYGGVAGRLARVPVVWHIRDRISDDYLPPRVVRFVRLAARVLPSAVIANSETTGATLGVPATIVPSPVVVAPLDRRTNGTFRVGMIGRIAPWKGQHVFLDAFAQAFGEGDERACVVGAPLFGADEEAYADRLRGLVTELDLDGRVEFTGFSHDVASELAHLDVLVHASTLPEPFGQVVVEGMAAGLAVVAANAGGPAEIVETETTGLLYPPGDAVALAAVLRRLAGDAGLRLRLGEAARERARAFSPETVAAQVEAVYRRVL
jgi:glycosyltransferase involved in cell wall biosynthesis